MRCSKRFKIVPSVVPATLNKRTVVVSVSVMDFSNTIQQTLIILNYPNLKLLTSRFFTVIKLKCSTTKSSLLNKMVTLNTNSLCLVIKMDIYTRLLD